jgi:hypothetical protein
MSFTGPTDDIIFQEGTFAYNFQASGAIVGGQAVEIQDTMKVAAPLGTKVFDNNSKIIGVAAYDVTDKEYVAVYGPGNIVRVIISGASNCLVGDILIPSSDGKFQNKVTAASYCLSGIKAIALETQATNNGTARVLLI